MRWGTKRIKADLSLFYRKLKDAIDWLRAPGETAWSVQNISKVNTKGLEIGFSFFPKLFFNTKYFSNLKFSYLYLDAERNTKGLESKYALDNIHHQFQSTVIIAWSGRLKHAVNAKHVKRVAGNSYTVMDSRMTYTLNNYKLFLEVTNLFDKKYIDSGFAPMPGRWIMGGITFTWD